MIILITNMTMKKFIFSLFALVGMTGTVSAQTLSVENVETVPGETAKAILNYSCTADTYTGMKITLQFPSDKFTVANTNAIKGSITNIEYSLGENSVTYTAAASDPFTTASIGVEFTISKDIAFDDYTVNVSGQLEGPNSAKAPISGSFTVKVLNLDLVELDEESTSAPAASTGAVNVLVKRTINANEWSTICLPFAMTGSQVTKAFGEDVMLADFASWSFEGSSASAVESLKLVFETISAADGIEANHPYMIKVSSQVSEFNANNVVIDPEEYPSKDVSYTKKNGKTTIYNGVGSAYGYYAMGTMDQGEYFVSGNNIWCNTKGNVTIKGFRGTFAFEGITLAAGARLSFGFDEETDAIDTVEIGVQDDNYYNLRGQRVDTPAKGIYIKNGKKVVVK